MTGVQQRYFFFFKRLKIPDDFEKRFFYIYYRESSTFLQKFRK